MPNRKRKRTYPKRSDKMRPPTNVESTIFYHVTSLTAADAILKAGFRDATGTYGTMRRWSGVWLSNVPLDVNEGCKGPVVLEVTLNMDESDLTKYEWVEEGKGYREWLIPAKIVNRGKAKRLT